MQCGSTIQSRDRPESKRSYFARFFGFACALDLRGFGGVASMRRTTSSSVGCGLGCGCFMVGVWQYMRILRQI